MAANPAPRFKPPRTSRSFLRQAVKWSWPILAAVAVGAVGGVGIASAIHMPRVRSLSEFTPSLITRLLDKNGDLFATFSRQRRVLLEEGEVPELLQQALIASEDQSFYRHGGIDLAAVFRAQLANLRAGYISEGASTLTMQLARELFLTRQRTWRRKIEEALLAVELEKSLTKQQILTLYVNLVNVGNGNYGMVAAARDYFEKPVDQLSLPQAATLVGILPAPSRFNPYRRPDLVLERRNSVLRRMHDAGFITREEHDAAVAEPLGVIRRPPRDRLGSYFAEDVRKHLETVYGTSAVVEGGLVVATTLDPAIQRSAEQALRQGLVRLDRRKGWRGAVRRLDAGDLATVELPSWGGAPPVPGRWYEGVVLEVGRDRARVKIEGEIFTLTPEGMAWTRRNRPEQILSTGDVAWFRLEAPEKEKADGEEPAAEGEAPKPVNRSSWKLHLEQAPELEGAVVVLESATGAVRAMVGGWSYERSKFNRASQALRQVGSAFKPFVYGAALELGFTPADTLFDAPTPFPGGDARLSYRPRNYYRDYHGIITLRRALEKSVNVSAVKLLDLVGVQRVIAFARDCGIESELPPYPSLALGTAEILPLELAAAYAAIANQGTYVEPYLIEQVTTADGELLEEHRPETHSAMDPRAAYVLTHMLEGVVDRGTATKIRDLDLDVAGKTGTTDDFSDAWFVGFTPRYTLLTWVGYDVKRSIGRGMTGAEAALPIWKQLAEAGLADGWLEKGARFPVPPGVAIETVEYTTGLLPGPGAGRFVEEAFLEGTEPTRHFSPQWASIMSLPWYQQLPFYIPKEGERMPTGRIVDEDLGDGTPQDDLDAPVTEG